MVDREGGGDARAAAVGPIRSESVASSRGRATYPPPDRVIWYAEYYHGNRRSYRIRSTVANEKSSILFNAVTLAHATDDDHALELLKLCYDSQHRRIWCCRVKYQKKTCFFLFFFLFSFFLVPLTLLQRYCLYRCDTYAQKTANMPRRPRRNLIDRNRNVNLPRPSARQPQPSAGKNLQNRNEPWLEPHKCEMSISA